MADFDYVVIGSGAGGGPVAANLANAGFTVCLLEAGGDPASDSELGRNIYEVPIFHALSTEFDQCQWDYFVRHYGSDLLQKRDGKFVEKDPAGGADVNGVWYPRAGALGGCTAHNAMITVTPQDADWEYIANLTGDRSWRADQMNGFFTRLERNRYLPRPGTLSYLLRELRNSGHGFDGWLTTSEASPFLALKDSEIIEIILNAVKQTLETGSAPGGLTQLLTLLDPNDLRNGKHMKAGLVQTPMAVAAGKRNGPRDYLLRTKTEHPSNLSIQLNALATRLVLDTNNRAVAVEFLEGKSLYKADPRGRKNGAGPGIKRTVSAKKEIILAGGAFNSPQLLMLSGIGSAAELAKHGIVGLVDLPGVGRNLQDRYEVGVISEFPEPFALLKDASFEPPKPGVPDPFFDLWKQGKGIYATNGSLIGIVKRSHPSKPEPDLYIFGLPSYFPGYKPGYSKEVEQVRSRFTWAILKAYTENNAGTVTLRSNDPRDWPDINFHYFAEGNDSQGADLDAVIAGVEFVRQMNGHMNGVELVPGARGDTPENLRQFIQDEAWGHHASCTNKIGRDDDPMAVLDSRFRVRGVKGLRVVDASVFPKIPGYFIVSAVYMIAEKASDVIAEDA